MKNNKGFAPIVAVLIVLGLIAAGSAGYAVFKRMQTPETPKQPLVADETVNWQTYRNEQYGFEFKYPAELSVITENEVISLENHYNSFGQIDIIADRGDSVSFTCPMGPHEIECGNFTNKNGVSYIRSIGTGQLQFDKQKQITVFFNPETKTSLPILAVRYTALISDTEGNTDAIYQETAKVANQILSTFKFTK
jgi:hypothetical protein